MKRQLRVLIGEFLIETGTIIRDIGGFVLPHYERHPAFQQDLNGDRESVRSTLADRASVYRSLPSE